MQYKVVREKKIDLLETKVSELLAQGWHPCGGLLLVDAKSEESKRVFCQAVVKPA